ncbi:hypothetical protein D9M69_638750 [compost metagenome]
MNAGDQVYEEVTGYPRTVILVITPAEKPGGVKGPLRGIAQEPVPIYGGGRGIGRNRVIPGTYGIEAIIRSLNKVDMADLPGVDHPPGFFK